MGKAAGRWDLAQLPSLSALAQHPPTWTCQGSMNTLALLPGVTVTFRNILRLFLLAHNAPISSNSSCSAGQDPVLALPSTFLDYLWWPTRGLISLVTPRENSVGWEGSRVAIYTTANTFSKRYTL